MDRPFLWILDEHGVPRPEPDSGKWAEWFIGKNDEERAAALERRRVGLTDVGNVLVSTVFIGTDCGFVGDGPPILWETMVFRNDGDNECARCAGSREQAEEMHRRTVEALLWRPTRIIRRPRLEK